jgi:hypothetical protein
LYYRHEDWPAGAELALGHVMLTGLFCCLALAYGSVLAVHLLHYSS